MMTPAHDLFATQPPPDVAWHSMLRYLALEDATPLSAPTTSETTTVTSEQSQQFENFFQDFAQPLFGYLWRMLGDEQAAGDVMQETFVRAWQHYERVSHYERPDSWLFRVATNLALNHRRDQARPLANAVPVQEGDSQTQRDIGSLLALRDLVREALLALSPRQRSALVLREIYGLSLKEISQVLHLAPNTVKVTLWRAREQFRAHYQHANTADEATSAPSDALAQEDRGALDDAQERYFSSAEEQI